jgi:predicted nucleic acid-binding protein
MLDSFFDTSALGKHYHPEVGTSKVDQLLAVQGTRHFISRLTVVEIQSAQQLLRRIAPAQNLRTLDALQLAVALSLHGQGLVNQLVCADQGFCSIAAVEGLTTINPELP